MIYLLLIFRYNISQKKIAFISANISSNNDKIKIIQDMLEIIVKSKFKELSQDDKMSYRTYERNLGKNILAITSSKEKEWETFIDGKNNVNDKIDVDELVKTIKSLPLKYHEKFDKPVNSIGNENNSSSAQVKYNHVKEQFDKIGFAMPAAFEKPRIGEKYDKRYSFLEWENEIYSDLYNAIRSNVLEMCIILINFFEKGKNSKDIYADFLNLLTCNSDEKKCYDAIFFARYLRNYKGIFAINRVDNIDTQCERAIKEISALWEASALPIYEKNTIATERGGSLDKSEKRIKYRHSDNCYYACHATMKIIRNWIGHQGIRNIDIKDVGFVFLVCMRGMFNIDKLPSDIKDSYKECERRILELFEFDNNVKEDINKSLNYFCNLNDSTKVGNNSSRDIYERISGLGHAMSKIRRDVSMDEIYMLYYHTMMCGDCYDEYQYIIERIKSRTWKDWKNRYNSRFRKYIECS